MADSDIRSDSGAPSHRDEEARGIEPESSPLVGLRSWAASDPSGCGPLLLDLRSAGAHRRRRLHPSRCVPWRTLESAWFTLPAYGVPFALLLPKQGEIEEEDAESNANGAAEPGSAAGACGPSMPPPAAVADECAEPAECSEGHRDSTSSGSSGDGTDAATTAASSSSSSSASSGSLGVKARVKCAPPVPPSSASFVYSRAAILSLLRFYGWVVPDEWAWEDGPSVWEAARAAGLQVRGPADPLEPALLFRPSPYLIKHFAHMHARLCEQRNAHTDAVAALGDSNGAADRADSPPSPRCKQARSATAACVSSGSTGAAGASPTHAASSASSAFFSSESGMFHALDVACGSGRDLAWLLHESDRMAAAESAATTAAASAPPSVPRQPVPLWRASGIDSSGGALARARSLAQQLGVGDRLRVARARINQSNGEWHFSGVPVDAAATNQKQHDGSVVPAVTADAQAAAAGVAPSDSQPQSHQSQQSQQSPSVPGPTPAVPLTGAAQRREKRRQKDALRAAATAAAATAVAGPGSASSASSPRPILAPRQYDLVVMVRFLSRTFIRQQLSSLLRPGGFFLLSTFINDGVTVYQQPSNPEFRIQSREELVRLCSQAGLVVVCNEIGRCEDGRPVSELLARKPHE